MTTFIVKIRCDNAAFCALDEADDNDFDRSVEVARILRELSEAIYGRTEFRPSDDPIWLYDYNGNPVGTAELTDR